MSLTSFFPEKRKSWVRIVSNTVLREPIYVVLILGITEMNRLQFQVGQKEMKEVEKDKKNLANNAFLKR